MSLSATRVVTLLKLIRAQDIQVETIVVRGLVPELEVSELRLTSPSTRVIPETAGVVSCCTMTGPYIRQGAAVLWSTNLRDNTDRTSQICTS